MNEKKNLAPEKQTIEVRAALQFIWKTGERHTVAIQFNWIDVVEWSIKCCFFWRRKIKEKKTFSFARRRIEIDKVYVHTEIVKKRITIFLFPSSANGQVFVFVSVDWFNSSFGFE